MSQRLLITAFGTSLIVHLALLSIISPLFDNQPAMPAPLPVALLPAYENQTTEPYEPASKAPVPRRVNPQSRRVIPPKLIAKPKVFDGTPVGNTEERTKDSENPPQAGSQLASSAPETGSPTRAGNDGGAPSDSTAEAAGAGVFFDADDGLAISGSVAAGLSGPSVTESKQRAAGKGSALDGTASGIGGGPLTGPSGGYQSQPRYPESARRAGAQGTTLLKLQVLETGRVGEVLIEKSAGHRDLDNAAIEAVKRWSFAPARLGPHAVAVWVSLPVKFELKDDSAFDRR